MTSDSILVIDASRLFREGLRRICSDCSFAVAHESGSVDEALPFIVSLQPTLVLVGLTTSHDPATARLGEIHAVAPRSRVVVLTEIIRVDWLAEALLAGIDGYLLKNMSADALHQSLRLVLLGEKVFPTDLADLFTNGSISSRSEFTKIGHSNGLSDREMQILCCLLDGAQNKEIARELNIAEGTVKVHLKTILKKIHVANRTQAAIWARDHGVRGGRADRMEHMSA
jgi:two-component system, NarL family, nitrate/nitrite response regulator NarL